MRIKLREDVIEALQEWNLKKTGRGMKSGYLTDPEAIERFKQMALPNENINDTILRLLSQDGAGTAIN